MARTNTNIGTSGAVQSVTGVAPITVNNTDPLNPIVSFNDTYLRSLNGLVGAVTISEGARIHFTTVGNDIQISADADLVTSVNGKIGDVVLTTTDVAEGGNLYFTDARAIAATAGLYVGLTGDETVDGIKTFNDFPVKSGSLVPIDPNQFVTKDYADAIALGFKFKASVQAATTVPLPAVTYNNGAFGVGATLTANVNGLIPDIDGYTPQVGDRILVKDQFDPIENGIYDVTSVGSGGSDFVLTRSSDFNSTATIGQGSACLVLNGTPYAPPGSLGNYASQFAVLTADPITVGSDQIIWSRISLPIQYFAGSGLTLIGTTFSVDPIYSPFNTINSTTIYSAGLSGTGTGNATGHNFFVGVNAASGATNVDNGIFIGHSSGLNATNANNAIFLGQQSGYQATSAFDAVFIGNGSGFNASASSSGVFIGRDTGSGATNADGSVFIGNSAGNNATFASHLVAIGVLSGGGATNADNGIFLGESSGQNAANAYDAIFIGTNSGKNDLVNNAFGQSSIAIGSGSGTGGFSNSIALGAGAINNRTNQFLVASSYSHWSIRGIDYAMPTAGAAGVLTNDGSNNLSFAPITVSSPFQFFRNTANLTRTNSTVLTLVTGMIATVTAGKTYQFSVTLFTTSGAGGIKAAMTLSGGATGTMIYQGDAIQNGTAITSNRAAAQNTAVAAVTAVTTATIHITGTFVCTVGGAMRVTFGQNVANAAASVVLANSIFQIVQIN